MLDDQQLERFSRQLLVGGFDVAGQERLLSASVLVAGLGGLGSPVALYLAAAGVGRLVLADGDRVDRSNLQRQVAHGETDIGSNKADSAAAAVRALNSDCHCEVVDAYLTDATLAGLMDGVDLVVDATDNYAARFLLNRACIAARVPLVFAAAVRTEGQLAVFDPVRGGPCYRCLYPEESTSGLAACSDSGVLAPVVGVMGSLQAMEAVKILSGCGEPLVGCLLMFDLLGMQVSRLKVPERADCPDCAHLRQPG